MGVRELGASLALTLLSATVTLAQEGTKEVTEQAAPPGACGTLKTAVLLPFKGVVCGVGAVAMFPAYWLSGFDEQVEDDTGVLLASHCNARYLLSPEWKK